MTGCDTWLDGAITGSESANKINQGRQATMDQMFMAKSPSETQDILQSELSSLGAVNIREGDKAIRYRTESLAAQLSYSLK
jgi:hypothetical protein